MRNLAFTSDSPQSIKLGDSNDTLSLRVTELDQPVDLSKASSITVKIGNTLGFLTEIDVAISSLLHPTDGRIDVVISSKISSELPAGQYLLEVWIDDAQGNTAIYPDTSYPSVIGFSIKKNIMVATSTVIATLTLADFEAKFDAVQKDLQDKVTSGYFKGDKGAKGDKGDTGTVDNAGLTTVPAFQALQTQVDNSAVGTNLIIQSSLKNGYINRYNGSVLVDKENFYSDNYIATNGKTVFTFSSPDYVFKGSTSNSLAMYDSNKNYIGYQNITSATQTLSNSNAAYIRFSINFVVEGGTTGASSDWLGNHRYKLEKGNVATDWCPNSSEILTQSDYAKIKAAIVALGGALS